MLTGKCLSDSSVRWLSEVPGLVVQTEDWTAEVAGTSCSGWAKSRSPKSGKVAEDLLRSLCNGTRRWRRGDFWDQKHGEPWNPEAQSSHELGHDWWSLGSGRRDALRTLLDILAEGAAPPRKPDSKNGAAPEAWMKHAFPCLVESIRVVISRPRAG